MHAVVSALDVAVYGATPFIVLEMFGARLECALVSTGADSLLALVSSGRQVLKDAMRSAAATGRVRREAFETARGFLPTCRVVLCHVIAYAGMGAPPAGKPGDDVRAVQQYNWDVEVARVGPPSVGCWNPLCVKLSGDSEDAVVLQRCMGCGVAKYCSGPCQVEAWGALHSRTCATLKAASQQLPQVSRVSQPKTNIVCRSCTMYS